jgi:hypothetical protein
LKSRHINTPFQFTLSPHLHIRPHSPLPFQNVAANGLPSPIADDNGQSIDKTSPRRRRNPPAMLNTSFPLQINGGAILPAIPSPNDSLRPRAHSNGIEARMKTKELAKNGGGLLPLIGTMERRSASSIGNEASKNSGKENGMENEIGIGRNRQKVNKAKKASGAKAVDEVVTTVRVRRRIIISDANAAEDTNGTEKRRGEDEISAHFCTQVILLAIIQ